MLVWFYVCPCLLSLGGSLKPEQRNVVNKSGVVKIRMYSDVRNGELLSRKKVSLNRKWKQFLYVPGEATVPLW